jgi:hypothetical protein
MISIVLLLLLSYGGRIVRHFRSWLGSMTERTPHTTAEDAFAPFFNYTKGVKEIGGKAVIRLPLMTM